MPWKVHLEDDCPFPQVGYVNFLESSSCCWFRIGTFAIHVAGMLYIHLATPAWCRILVIYPSTHLFVKFQNLTLVGRFLKKQSSCNAPLGTHGFHGKPPAFDGNHQHLDWKAEKSTNRPISREWKRKNSYNRLFTLRHTSLLLGIYIVK